MLVTCQSYCYMTQLLCKEMLRGTCYVQCNAPRSSGSASLLLTFFLYCQNLAFVCCSTHYSPIWSTALITFEKLKLYVSCLLLLLYFRSKYYSQQSVLRQKDVDGWGRTVRPPWTVEPKRRQNIYSRILLIRALVIQIANYP